MPACLFWWDYDNKDKKENTTLLPMMNFIAFTTINQNKEVEETEEHACTFDWLNFDHVTVVY